MITTFRSFFLPGVPKLGCLLVAIEGKNIHIIYFELFIHISVNRPILKIIIIWSHYLAV